MKKALFSLVVLASVSGFQSAYAAMSCSADYSVAGQKTAVELKHTVDATNGIQEFSGENEAYSFKAAASTDDSTDIVFLTVTDKASRSAANSDGYLNKGASLQVSKDSTTALVSCRNRAE